MTRAGNLSNHKSLKQAIEDGRTWAHAYPNASKSELDARIKQCRAAWGDIVAHCFWRGATER